MNEERARTERMLRAGLEDLEAFGIGDLERRPLPMVERALAPEAALDPDSAVTAEERLSEIASRIAACERCPLCATRTRVVPGQGASSTEILFIGEAPGRDEDQAGLAFVGAAGQLLTKMIEAMGFSRDEVFIANVLKCRPPGNRDPQPEEVAHCLPFLHEQIEVLRPKILVTLGAHASRGLLNTTEGIGRLRGVIREYRGIPLVATYHPAYLLRSPGQKKAAWLDLQLVLEHLGRPIPGRGGR